MDRTADGDGPARRTAGRELIALAAVGLGLLGLLAAWVARPSTGRGGRVETARGYVGAQSCRECHPGEFASYQTSGHARTLRPAADRDLARWLDGRTVEDPEQPGVTWTYALRDGQFEVERRQGAGRETFPIDWAFGSGQHAVTFVSLTDRDPARPAAREQRLTYFAHDRSLRITPGQEAFDPHPGTTPVGRDLDARRAHHCFECHTTRTSAAGPRLLDEATLTPGVSCERCHGPGAEHVRKARAGSADLAMPMGPGRWTADGQMAACGQCHRHPSQAPPGGIRTDNPEIVRFQPVGLMQSACYKQSDGRLSCVTCHDPHAGASPIRSVYEAACLDCHGGGHAGGVPCPVSPASGCVDCHMPKLDAGQGVLFTDHWIRVREDEPQATARR